MEGFDGPGAAGADSRLNTAKFTDVGRHFGSGANVGAKIRTVGISIQERRAVFRRVIEDAARDGTALIGKDFVRDALLYVVGFSEQT